MDREKIIKDLEQKILELNSKLDECKKQAKMFKQVVDVLEDSVYIYDKKGTLIYMNEVAEKLEGKKLSSIKGKTEVEIWNTTFAVDFIKDQDSQKNTKIHYITPNNKKIQILHSMYPYYCKNNETAGCFSINKDITIINAMANDIYELNQRLENSKKNLNNGTRYTLDDIVGDSNAIKRYVKNARKVAKYECNILIYGETGTGKELIAQGIHNESENAKHPFIGLNCSAIPSNLVESTLFGTTKGSFTGAADTKGLFEQAGEGTLFLDEINSMPIDMQAKLLRVLQEKKYRKIGGNKDLDIKCRVISATNVEPEVAIEKGQMRQDLYYRLATVMINVPPLREREGDIEILLYYFMEKYNRIFNKNFKLVDQALINACSRYSWPGNIRQLEHLIESALIIADNSNIVLTLDLFPVFQEYSVKGDAVYEDYKESVEITQIDLAYELNKYEKSLIRNALINNSGNISATARQLSVHRSVLYNKIKKLNIDFEKFIDVY